MGLFSKLGASDDESENATSKSIHANQKAKEHKNLSGEAISPLHVVPSHMEDKTNQKNYLQMLFNRDSADLSEVPGAGQRLSQKGKDFGLKDSKGKDGKDKGKKGKDGNDLLKGKLFGKSKGSSDDMKGEMQDSKGKSKSPKGKDKDGKGKLLGKSKGSSEDLFASKGMKKGEKGKMTESAPPQ